MKCLGCGYCCIELSVIIINPDSVRKNLNFDELKDKDVLHKPSGFACPHLIWSLEGKSICSIHHYDWFKQTPCHSHSQIEKSYCSKCRMGEYILAENNTEIRQHLQNTIYKSEVI